MENLISMALLASTALAYVVIAAFASRGIATKENYLLGNRDFSFGSITMTLIATQLGAGMMFGTAAESYAKGISGIAYVLGMAIGLIVLGLGVGARLRSLEITTTAELFETKYGSKNLRRFAAIISILTMGGILSAQMVASRQLFNTLFDISPIWLIIFWAAVIMYTAFGGIKAIIATDIFQVLLIVLVFTAVLFYIVPLGEFIPLLSRPLAPEEPLFADGFFPALLAPIFFSIIEQDLAQRCFAARTRGIAAAASLTAALFLLIYAFVPIFLGMFAKSIGIEVVAGESPLIILLKQYMPPLGITIVACALLAAICSTADSLLGAAATNLIADFLPSDQKHSLLMSRLLTCIVGLCAMLIAFNFDNVIKIIIKSYEISICTVFVPTVAAMFIKQPSKLGAVSSIFLGIITFTLGTYANTALSPTMLALLVSFFTFIIGSAIERSRIG